MERNSKISISGSSTTDNNRLSIGTTGLSIPPYHKDAPFVTAIRQGKNNYILQRLRSNHLLIRSYFYHEYDLSVKFGIYTDELLPPLRLVFTPLSFAVFYKQEELLKNLLQLGASPYQCSIIIDCPIEDKKQRWKVDVYRLTEVSPIMLTRPGEECFNIFMLNGYDLTTEFALRFRICSNEKECFRVENAKGLWELYWLFYKPMSQASVLLEITEKILERISDPSLLLATLDLNKLAMNCFILDLDQERGTDEKRINNQTGGRAKNFLKFLQILHKTHIKWDNTDMIKQIPISLYVVWTIFKKCSMEQEATEVMFLGENLLKSSESFKQFFYQSESSDRLLFYKLLYKHVFACRSSESAANESFPEN